MTEIFQGGTTTTPSIRNASEVESMPTRLRSTSASLRIWTVATSATSSAISQTLIPRARDARRAVLGRADMRNLEARVVCRQGDVGAALESQVDLKLNLPGANVRQRGRIVKRLLHPVAGPDRR